ncbi:hypothetical protein B0H11DRAFT_1358809 [Mycena galericulata]|nr:hypothetical protein B0H11DRAFT_1358809 [Mycena galericulata]
MPPNPLPYQCGTPGCTRRFEKPEHLRQHTKDFHSPSRPLPSSSQPSRPPPPRPPPSSSKPSRPAPPRPPPSSSKPSRPPPSSSTPSRPPPPRSQPSRPPPKQQTLPYQCGTPGCTRKFEKPEHLHQHTKDFHSPSRPQPQARPKSNQSTPSGSSTLAVQRSTSAFSRGRAVANTQSASAPVLMIQHLPPPTQYLPPYVYPSQPSASLIAHNPPDYTSVASDTQEELLQRLTQLELGQRLIDKSTLKVGMNFVELAEDIIRSSANVRRISFLDRLQERVEWMSKHNDVCSLAYSGQFRTDVGMV